MPEKKIIASFYKFIDWSDFQEKKPVLEKICRQNNIVGTILLAPEGINGTISGSHEEILKTIEELKKDVRLSDLESKFAEALGETFKRMKIRLKKEIVSMGKENINPGQITGTHVSAEEWNEIIQDPNTLVVDTRNKYEHAIGNFEGSIDPKTTSFRQFPKWVEEKLKPLILSIEYQLEISLEFLSRWSREVVTIDFLSEHFPRHWHEPQRRGW